MNQATAANTTPERNPPTLSSGKEAPGARSLEVASKPSGPVDYRRLLDESWDELHLQLERHRRLVRSAMEGRPQAGVNCLAIDCPHRRALVDLVLHSIRVLEDTRRAFKSKQLEALRKEFLRVLGEEMMRGQAVSGLPQE